MKYYNNFVYVPFYLLYENDNLKIEMDSADSREVL